MKLYFKAIALSVFCISFAQAMEAPKTNRTLLHEQVLKGMNTHDLVLLDECIKNGFKINKSLNRKTGFSLLHTVCNTLHQDAANLPVLKWALQQKDIDVNLPDENGFTPAELILQTHPYDDPIALSALEFLKGKGAVFTPTSLNYIFSLHPKADSKDNLHTLKMVMYSLSNKKIHQALESKKPAIKGNKALDGQSKKKLRDTIPYLSKNKVNKRITWCFEQNNLDYLKTVAGYLPFQVKNYFPGFDMPNTPVMHFQLFAYKLNKLLRKKPSIPEKYYFELLPAELRNIVFKRVINEWQPTESKILRLPEAKKAKEKCIIS